MLTKFPTDCFRTAVTQVTELSANGPWEGRTLEELEALRTSTIEVLFLILHRNSQ